MARRLIRRPALTLLATGLTFVFVACSSSSIPQPAVGLTTKTVPAGEVEVTITPTRLDDGGATFAVVFDTHSVELDLDVAENASLTVDGEAWLRPAWSGAKPGGHHREGTLEFTAGGPARGSARLVIMGLERPVDASWPL